MPPSPPPTLLPMAWHGDTMGQTRNRPKCTTITEALTKTASCTLYMYRAKKVKGTTKKLMAQFPPPTLKFVLMPLGGCVWLGEVIKDPLTSLKSMPWWHNTLWSSFYCFTFWATIPSSSGFVLCMGLYFYAVIFSCLCMHAVLGVDSNQS